MQASVSLRALSVCLVLAACSEGSERDSSLDAEADDGAAEAEVVSDASAEDAAQDAQLDAAAEDAEVPAARLSETGLYANLSKGELGAGVRAFTPQGVLWSDGADKQRWVYLPPGTRIDSSNIDGWKRPVKIKK